MDEFDSAGGFAATVAPLGTESFYKTPPVEPEVPQTTNEEPKKPVTKDVYCCAVDRLIHNDKSPEKCPSGPSMLIRITDAFKNSDGSGGHFLYVITYKVIETG